MPLVKLPLLLVLLLPMVRCAAAACAGAAAAAAADTVGEAGTSSFGGRGYLVKLDGRVRKWVAVVHLSFFWSVCICVGGVEKLVTWEGSVALEMTEGVGSASEGLPPTAEAQRAVREH